VTHGVTLAGPLAGYDLPYGAHFDRRLGYLPAVDNFTKSYLLRTEGGLTVPLIAPVGAQFLLSNESNSKLAPGAKHNSLLLTLGLSVVW
jgi:hypothetical protein